jgi:TetR/AcrR family transcriptional repressor of nem operon
MGGTKNFDEKEVLEKAVNLFWNKGFNGTSMQDLVSGLGISRSSLYDTFGDKHQLYLKALESYKHTYAINLCAVLDESKTVRVAVAQLLALVANNLLNDERRRGCFMVNAGVELASHDTEVNGLVCQTEKQLEQAFFQILEQGQANGEISKDNDVLALAGFFTNTVRGLNVLAKTSNDRLLFDDIIQIAVSVLDKT